MVIQRFDEGEGNHDSGDGDVSGKDAKVESEMSEESPVATTYRNVRDMSRRDYLKLAGLAVGGYGVWEARDAVFGSGTSTAVEGGDEGYDGGGGEEAGGAAGTVETGPYEIRVEVDWMEGVDPLTDREQRLLVNEFDEAPVEADIDLILERDEEVPASDLVKSEEGPGELDDWGEYIDAYFDHSEDPRYIHALLAKGLILDYSEEAISVGVNRAGSRAILVRDDLGKRYPDKFDTDGTDFERHRASMFMHELGHTLGLNDFRGIDSTDIPFEDYPSVMNYNSNFTTFRE